MHEVSIAQNLIDELEKIARCNKATKILRVNLKIGQLSGIVTASLIFAFEALKQEHPVMSSAEIVINEIPLVYLCNDCDSGFESDDAYFPSCPNCSSFKLTIESGEEQHIDNVEVEV